MRGRRPCTRPILLAALLLGLGTTRMGRLSCCCAATSSMTASAAAAASAAASAATFLHVPRWQRRRQQAPSNSGQSRWVAVPGGGGGIRSDRNQHHHRPPLPQMRLQARKSRRGGGGRSTSSSSSSGSSSRGGGRGRRRRRKDQDDDDDASTAAANNNNNNSNHHAPPKSYRRSTLRIRPLRAAATSSSSSSSSSSPSSSSSRPHIDIAMVDIDDADWWEAQTLAQEASERQLLVGQTAAAAAAAAAANNPFGTRAWPPSLVVAQLLAGLPPSDLAGRPVLELGCGTGLVSIAAAGLGAAVVATDVSPLALRLARRGWEETVAGLQRRRRQRVAGARSSSGGSKSKSEGKGDGAEGGVVGTLSTSVFDVTSSDPLPVDWHRRGPRERAGAAGVAGEEADPLRRQQQQQQTEQQQPIVVATSVLYEADLAEAMANRVAEAAAMGAWVIVGDCDSGQREGGRERFEVELEKKLKKSIRAGTGGGGHDEQEICWNPAVARCPELGWREKNVRLLHLNSPDGY